MFAMWNGKGFPQHRRRGDPVGRAIMQVALTAVMFASHANIDVAVAEVRRRAGTQLDPNLADLLVERADELLGDLDEMDAYQAVLDTEPEPVRRVEKGELADVARTFGNLVDLKSPWLHGHSAGVGDLAAAAAGMFGLREDMDTVRVAGYLHDLGRVGVSSAIWDKAGPLSGIERDQARLHAYHSERILARIPPLTGLAKLAGQHHERCDGSGYHRGSTAAQLSMASRILACADAYRRLIEDRPYRRALVPARAADRLEAEARAGRLDADAAAAVIEAAGLRRASSSALAQRTSLNGKWRCCGWCPAGCPTPRSRNGWCCLGAPSSTTFRTSISRSEPQPAPEPRCSRCSTDCLINLGSSAHAKEVVAPSHCWCDALHGPRTTR